MNLLGGQLVSSSEKPVCPMSSMRLSSLFQPTGTTSSNLSGDVTA